MDLAEYTPQELARLQLGYIVREQPQQGQTNTTSSNLSSRKRDLQRGQQAAREEMLDDLGFQ